MKISIYVATKWHGCEEEIVIDLDELGFTEQEWDNMSEDERQEQALQIAYDAIGFSFNYNYVD